MTLATTTRYDPDRVSRQGGSAVVMGGSMAGLLAARVLSDAYDEVVVVERDPIPSTPTPRRGVPQGHHVHVLLEAGRATLCDLFPGYGEDLIDAGALIINVGEDLEQYEAGGFLAPPATRMEMYCASRPLLEGVARDRLGALDAVELRGGCRFTDYVVDDGRVEGVRVRADDDTGTIPADLVVDATGRTSRTPRWLTEHGYEIPPTVEVDIDFTYSTIRIDRPREARRMLFAPQSAPRTTGGAAFPIEDGEWLVTLGGMHDSDPPSTVAAFETYADRLPIDGVRELVAEREVVSDGVDRYPFPSNRRRRYEDLDDFPEGLVVTGDAIASFNPIYGQGMSVAALEAIQLHHLLASGNTDAISQRFFAAAADVVDIAWSMAVGADSEFEATSGPTPTGAGLFNRYLNRLVRRAHTDEQLAEAYYRVVGMERPPTALLRPRTVWRTLRPEPVVEGFSVEGPTVTTDRT
ncbi:MULTISPECIES: FAD-dependent oxidoreductase [Halolamina]|uniref:2-polyprenyl-6-methoxyphenol hydroxylase n=1 Tax=Halolamina pelagica TaxID=699431 RepID=A0A1I5P7W2_9EURY|nr:MULTISPECIES: FAD-dependent monooxygenase [Halolamina]NHX36667.1 oxidoreductase [Halolamina sp. R1-12]SFP29890.1 2-polyprenyl-6-methoxyphenol hydroxylase [Halolamina pelagica]